MLFIFFLIRIWNHHLPHNLRLYLNMFFLISLLEIKTKYHHHHVQQMTLHTNEDGVYFYYLITIKIHGIQHFLQQSIIHYYDMIHRHDSTLELVQYHLLQAETFKIINLKITILIYLDQNEINHQEIPLHLILFLQRQKCVFIIKQLSDHILVKEAIL